MRHHIAVVICTWNRVKMLSESLRSLRQVHVPADWKVEVLVVDNNSRDETQAYLESLQADWTLGKLHASFEPRQGKQFALNRGISQARSLGCSLIAFTDDDVLFPTNWLENVVAAMYEGPTLPALAGGRTQVIWPDGKSPPWYHRNMGAIVGEVDLGDHRRCPPPEDYAPAGANLLARIDLFDRVGGFSETHFRHMDYEFGQRVISRGECVAYVPSVLVIAPVDPAIVTKRYFRRWSLKAGISPWSDMELNVRHFAWVPLWLYRQMAEDALAWLVGPLRGEALPNRFLRELRLWRAYGTLASRWMSRLRPGGYPAWVESRSQKLKNVY